MPLLIRVLVLEDELLVRNSLRILLSTTRDLRLVGETTELEKLSHLCTITYPQIVLIGGV